MYAPFLPLDVRDQLEFFGPDTLPGSSFEEKHIARVSNRAIARALVLYGPGDAIGERVVRHHARVIAGLREKDAASPLSPTRECQTDCARQIRVP